MEAGLEVGDVAILTLVPKGELPRRVVLKARVGQARVGQPGWQQPDVRTVRWEWAYDVVGNWPVSGLARPSELSLLEPVAPGAWPQDASAMDARIEALVAECLGNGAALGGLAALGFMPLKCLFRHLEAEPDDRARLKWLPLLRAVAGDPYDLRLRAGAAEPPLEHVRAWLAWGLQHGMVDLDAPCGSCDHERREHPPNRGFCGHRDVGWDRGEVLECDCNGFVEPDGAEQAK